MREIVVRFTYQVAQLAEVFASFIRLEISPGWKGGFGRLDGVVYILFVCFVD